TKKYLSTLNVSEEGVFCAGPGVGTRKQEVERARMRVVNAQKLNLQRVAEDLLEEGDAIQENVRPQVKSKRPSLPVKRSHEVLSAIDTKLNSLACFTNAEGKVELARKGSGIFVNYGRLSVGRLRYKNKPKSMFLYILKLCLPEEILVMDGVSSSVYVQNMFIRHGGKLEDIDYDPLAVLQNLIDNSRRKLGVTINREIPSSSSTPFSSPQHTTLESDTSIFPPNNNIFPPHVNSMPVQNVDLISDQSLSELNPAMSLALFQTPEHGYADLFHPQGPLGPHASPVAPHSFLPTHVREEIV
ncbi:RNA-binding motif, single-stranded-interacting protein 3, partial [Frankliniella fusca]